MNNIVSKRHAEILPLKEVIDDMLKTYNISTKYKETQLIHSWKEIMGNAIASRTKNLYFKKKVLYVELTSAPLRMELSMAKKKLLELLNKNFDEPVVIDIIFK